MTYLKWHSRRFRASLVGLRVVHGQGVFCFDLISNETELCRALQIGLATGQDGAESVDLCGVLWDLWPLYGGSLLWDEIRVC